MVAESLASRCFHNDDWNMAEGERRRLRYPATCVVCEIALSPKTEAFWNRATKQVTCLACGGGIEIALSAAGTAGGSAEAIKDALVTGKVSQARSKYGDHAAAVAAKIAEREPSTNAWARGADGERRLAAFLERELGDRVIVLHDRVIPGSRANIDHLVIAAGGVWIVDAKAYKGKLEKRDVGPFWSTEYEVYINGRNRTDLVDGLTIQIAAVRAALEADPAATEIKLHPCLCFLESDWSLFARPFPIRGVTVLDPGALRSQLKKSGPLDPKSMTRIANRLALSLPAAA